MTRDPDQVLPKLIGLMGPHRAGKSTLANALVSQKGFQKLSFSTPIKDMLAALGLSREDIEGSVERRTRPNARLGGRSPRYALATLGVAWGRQLIAEDLWVQILSADLDRRIRSGASVVIDDVRFPNEWQLLQDHGAVLVRIRRDEAECEPKMGHESPSVSHTERYWMKAPCDLEIANVGTASEYVVASLAALANATFSRDRTA